MNFSLFDHELQNSFQQLRALRPYHAVLAFCGLWHAFPKNGNFIKDSRRQTEILGLKNPIFCL